MIFNLKDEAYTRFQVDVDTNCPYCNTPHVPIVLHFEKFTHPKKLGNDYLIVTLQCSHCLFPRSLMMENYDGCYRPIQTPFAKPLTNKDFINISDISPIGSETYKQAILAEESGYDQLVGIGLRKSLEFCLKDFLTNTKPDEAETIKKMPLKQLIDKYMNDPTLKKLSTASAFLGNDETHYVRKFEDKDIAFLKKYIDLTFQKIRQEWTALEIEKEFF